MGDIMAAHAWPSNAELIADVASLGYIGDQVLDLTYGRGVFWKAWRPRVLVTNDPFRETAEHHFDAREGPVGWLGAFDTVVFDPPYMLNGTPASGDFDNRYGVEVPQTIAERKGLLVGGSWKAWQYVKPGGTLLVKCMDQVASGKMQWQTDWVKHSVPAERVAQFHLLSTPRPQEGPQRHARNNFSTLMVFA